MKPFLSESNEVLILGHMVEHQCNILAHNLAKKLLKLFHKDDFIILEVNYNTTIFDHNEWRWKRLSDKQRLFFRKKYFDKKTKFLINFRTKEYMLLAKLVLNI